jgi:membrane peptidoglycan carboxypeptidase
MKIFSGFALLALLWIWGWVVKIKNVINNTPDGYELYWDLKKRVDRTTTLYGKDSDLDNDSEKKKNAEIVALLWWKWSDYITIEKINPYLVSGLIAVEDKRFRKHSGFDGRSVFGMLLYLRWWSTISSQIFKNKFSTNKNRARFNEKIEEWVKAYKIIGISDEEMKRFILEYYLNTKEFLANTIGIQEAARTLFWKDQSELEIDEAAMIVGLVQNPDRINPISTDADRRERAERRTDEVLRDLIRAVEEWVLPDHFYQKYPDLRLDPAQIEYYIAQFTLSKVKKNPSKRLSRINMIPHGTNEVTAEAQQKLNRSIQENEINLNGKTTDIATWWFKLKTTLDQQLQEWVLLLAQSFLSEQDKLRKHKEYPLDLAVLIVDNKTWAVRTDMRWRDFSKSELDFRRSSTEQWSVIKAVVDACALELGVISSLDESYVDQVYTLTSDEYSGITHKDGWTPENFEDKEYTDQTITIGEATLVKSLNRAIAFLFKKAVEQWQWQAFIDLLESKLTAVGINLPDHLQDNPQSGIWLWSWNFDQLAKLYSAIANWWSAPESLYTVTEIRDDQDGLLYTYDETIQTPMISLYSTEVVAQLVPYLEKKWKQVTWYDNCLAKSWTTWSANQLWMVVNTPGSQWVTMVVRLWPHEYSDEKGNIIGRWSGVDATSKLRPLVKNICALLEKEWYLDKTEKFSFGTTVTETPKTDSLQVQEPVEVEME